MNFRNIVFLMLIFGASSAWGMDYQVGIMKVFGEKKFIFGKEAQAFFEKKDIDPSALIFHNTKCYYPLGSEQGSAGYITFLKGIANHIFVDYTTEKPNEHQLLKNFYVIDKEKAPFEFCPKYKFFQCYINNNNTSNSFLKIIR